MAEVIHIPMESVAASYRKLGRTVIVTQGNLYEIPIDAKMSGLDWNQMNQDHHPWIQHTLFQSMRVAVSPEFQVSLTQFRFLGIPFLVHVSNIRVEPGVFFRCYNLLNLVQVHAVIRSLPGKLMVEHYYISHPVLKFIHRHLDKRLSEFNERLNGQTRLALNRDRP